MEIKHGEEMMTKDLYQEAKVKKSKYQGGKFEGNEVQKIVKKFNAISWPNNHPFKGYLILFNALEITNEFVFSIKMNLTDKDISDISTLIRDVLIQWESLTECLSLGRTLKLHILAVHCLEFAIKYRCTPAAFGEQDGEMLHRRFRQTLETYNTLGKKALLHATKTWNLCNF